MKIKNILTVMSLALLVSLSGCEEPSTDPSNSVDEITKSYKKVETGASRTEIDALITDAQTHLKEYVSRHKSAKDVSGAGYDVGVIPTSDNCPLWSEKVVIYVDNENDGPLTSTSGWKGAWTKESNGDAQMKFCKVDGRLFSNVKGTFGVVKFGPNNPTPTGSPEYGFRGVNLVLMDNEDDLGSQFFTNPGDAAPNYLDSHRNLRLFLNQFRWTGYPFPDQPTAFPDLGFSYGVFGTPELALETGELYTDDEDDGCTSDYVPYAGSQVGKEFSVVIVKNKKGEPTGTTFKLARVK